MKEIAVSSNSVSQPSDPCQGGVVVEIGGVMSATEELTRSSDGWDLKIDFSQKFSTLHLTIDELPEENDICYVTPQCKGWKIQIPHQVIYRGLQVGVALPDTNQADEAPLQGLQSFPGTVSVRRPHWTGIFNSLSHQGAVDRAESSRTVNTPGESCYEAKHPTRMIADSINMFTEPQVPLKLDSQVFYFRDCRDLSVRDEISI